jgi:predicted dehydrogenase
MNGEGIVRIGLIGLGAISAQHIEAINTVEGARLVAVADARPERARAVGERWNVAWTAVCEELMDSSDVDAISICTPSGLHAEQAFAALRRGKHVFVEKPLALSRTDAQRVIDEGKRQGKVVSTVSQMRFEPIMQELHQAVTAGSFGLISLVVGEGLYHRPQSYYDSAAWRGTRDLDGGVLMNQAIHLVDLICWLSGPVRSVAAHVTTRGHRMEAEDTATLSLRFTSGALGVLVATTCAQREVPQVLRIYGDAGHAHIVGQEPVEWDVRGGARPDAIEPAAEPAARGFGTATWGTTALDHVRQYTDFIAAIRDGRPPSVTGEDGRRAVEVITAAYESDLTGRTVVVEGDS